jgi:hypothetical protein
VDPTIGRRGIVSFVQSIPQRDDREEAIPENHFESESEISVRSKDAPPAEMIEWANESGPSSVDSGWPSPPITFPPAPSKSNGNEKEVFATVRGCSVVNSRSARGRLDWSAREAAEPIPSPSPFHALWNPEPVRRIDLAWIANTSPD